MGGKAEVITRNFWESFRLWYWEHKMRPVSAPAPAPRLWPINVTRLTLGRVNGTSSDESMVPMESQWRANGTNEESKMGLWYQWTVNEESVLMLRSPLWQPFSLLDSQQCNAARVLAAQLCRTESPRIQWHWGSLLASKIVRLCPQTFDTPNTNYPVTCSCLSKLVVVLHFREFE